MSSRPPLFVHLLPTWIPIGSLVGGVAVVIDVLRASTTILHALQAGCESVIPCLEVEAARALARSLPLGEALLGGERGGQPIPGFDLGNAPEEYTSERCRGRTLVFTTTNGTRAIHACVDADEVYLGGFVNLAAIARLIERHLSGDRPQPVHLVCAGTDGQISFEDTLFAGALCRAVAYFQDQATPAGNDNALLAQAAAPRAYDQLPGLLRQGAGGRNLIEIGRAADIDRAAQVDRFDLVARLDRRLSPARIVATQSRQPV